MTEPIICFGQQPCGFFPKRFLVAKINTARALQKEIGGSGASAGGAKIVFFYHDSDADYRETITVMKDTTTGAEVRLNFLQENKLQKKFSPLYAKRIPAGWQEEILKQLPRFANKPLIELFAETKEKTVADFCLAMYQKMGLLDGIEILRSSNKTFREQAPDLAGEYFADVEYQNEVVRAKIELPAAPTTPPLGSARGTPPQQGGEAPQLSEDITRSLSPLSKIPTGASGLRGSPSRSEGEVVGVIHEGGNQFIRFPIAKPIEKWQKSAARDQRFAWMQSVINCTHYIYGEGEKEYLNVSPFPNIKFIDRDKISDPNYAWLG